MRIKFVNPYGSTPYPTLLSVAEMCIEFDGYIVEICFRCLETFMPYKTYVLYRETVDTADAEKAIQTFKEIQSSLALNGYANLVEGEQTSLIGEGWKWKALK